MTCVAPDDPGPRWLRFVLDSVLTLVALTRGAVALHAGCVAVEPDRCVAVVAGQGGGKTSLVAELLSRGAVMVADDVTVVDERLRAWPGPPVLNLALDRPFPPAARDLGEVLDTIDGEAWVSVPACSGPVGLQAVVLLDRTPTAETLSATTLTPSPLHLLGSVLPAGPEPAVQQRTFNRISDLVASVPVILLRAPLDVPPSALADALAAAIGNHGAA